MQPKITPPDNQNRLFQTRLENIVDSDHPLVKLADRIDWPFFEKKFGVVYIPDKGRPGLPTRLMVGLHYLKAMNSLSDERTAEMFLENPYWQYFCGLEFFVHSLPFDPSSMTRWRKRVGSRGFESLLSQTLEVAQKGGSLRESDFKRMNVDTTVQEKNITFPTDAKLLCKAIELIVRHSRRHGVELRQSYSRLSPKLGRDYALFSRSRKFKQAQKCVRTLRTYLGRLLRDVGRKASDIPVDFAEVLELAGRVYQQKKGDKDKLYSLFAPEVSCIAKGKAHKKYEFGSKASIVSTSKGNWVVGAETFFGNPFDGHTLGRSLSQVERISGHYPKEAYCDKGYRGKQSLESVGCDVLIPGVKGKRTPTVKKYLKRRNAIEPIIGHLKNDHGLDRNYLKGETGDRINLLLAACGFNMKKLLRAFLCLLFRSFQCLDFCGERDKFVKSLCWG